MAVNSYSQRMEFPIEVLGGQLPINWGWYEASGAPFLGCKTDTTVGCGHHRATACSLYSCVRFYKAIEQNGNFEETVVASSPKGLVWGVGDGAPFIWSIVDTGCLSTSEARHLMALGYDIDHRSRWLPYATCLGVRWPVIAVPATLVILTILFFILVLLSSASHDIEIWKSSPLPLLFNGLCYNHADRRSPDLLTQVTGCAVPWIGAEMERLSKKIVVKLGDCQRPTGWYEGIRKRDISRPDEKKDVRGKTC